MATEQKYGNTLTLPDTFLSVPPVAPTGTPGRKIVIAYDETHASDALLDRIIRTRLVEPDDDIHLVHILQQRDILSNITPIRMADTLMTNVTPYDRDTRRHQLEDDDDVLKDAEQQMLLAVADVLRKNSFKYVKCEVIQGDPKQSIIDYCISEKPLMLITGSRGFGKIKSTILGSVSHYLAKHCPCPVMVVKVTDEEVHARAEMTQKKQDTFRQRLASMRFYLSQK